MLQLSRRGLIGMFAAGVGAAIVRPGLIMPIKPALAFPRPELIVPTEGLDVGDMLTLSGPVGTQEYVLTWSVVEDGLRWAPYR